MTRQDLGGRFFGMRNDVIPNSHMQTVTQTKSHFQRTHPPPPHPRSPPAPPDTHVRSTVRRSPVPVSHARFCQSQRSHASSETRPVGVLLFPPPFFGSNCRAGSSLIAMPTFRLPSRRARPPRWRRRLASPPRRPFPGGAKRRHRHEPRLHAYRRANGVHGGPELTPEVLVEIRPGGVQPRARDRGG